MENNKRNLPTLAELMKDDLDVVKHNQLNVLLNQPPPKEWVKEHPLIKVKGMVNGRQVEAPLQYMPIERVEWLMFRIFIRWRVEVLEYKLIGNAVCVSVRLHYMNPVSGEWEWQDGVGAQPLQTKKGAGATDFNELNTSAVQMALPAAKSYALKDAAEMLGRLFGKDINRREDIYYDGLNDDKFEMAERIRLRKKVSDALARCNDQELHDRVLNALLDAESEGVDTISFLNQKLEELTHGTA